MEPNLSRPARVLVALGIGVLAALLVASHTLRTGGNSDFAFPWRGAQLLLAGLNPYHTLSGGLPTPFEEPIYYPATTLIVSTPLAGLTLPWAVALAMGVSCAALAFVVTRDGLWRIWVFASAPMIVAVHLGQWSPLLVAASLVPAAGFLYLTKPNIGLALYLARPTWTATVGCVVLLGVSLAVLPSWPMDWRANLDVLGGHPAPLATGWGLPALLALARWRRPEARLLVAMCCVPQLLYFADQLPLWLVPRTRGEMVALSLSSIAAMLGWTITAFFLFPTIPYVPQAAPWVLVGCYLPALVMVLRRPNEGPAPAWLERWLARVPEWIRGIPSDDPETAKGGQSRTRTRRGASCA